MFFYNADHIINTEKNNSLNPAPQFEKPFISTDKLIFSGHNRRNTYLEDNIRVGNYDRRYLYK
ncbi:MAG: hypothetical protein NC489_18490 [Ruminococcus flavefaciens]|nr:hypothetical protein [Ruminococcus flavefaciens]